VSAALELAWPDIEPSYEWYREELLAEAEEPPAILPAPTPPGRFPIMDRAELEAAIWHALTAMTCQRQTQGGFVDAILAAADAYATREALIAVEATP
jgi:hypothetical protein